MLKVVWCLCVVGVSQALNNPRVKTTHGWVVGRKAVDGDYFVFYGIPYAGPTSGTNRFKPPTPVPKHTEDFQAIHENIKCAQPNPGGTIIGVEDCLVLNIHTRNLTTAKPVFVWLEGEEYQTTTNRLYSYKSLVMEELVVVSINYRLSIFGFLCLRIPEAPGNAGLKDVVQGLKWIKDNIAGFGGDPNNVMMVGHGSGAAMVDLITLSPISKNLMHKAIVLSGTTFSPWALSYEPIKSAKAIGDTISPGLSGSQLANVLISMNIDYLNKLITSFEIYNGSQLFAPCIETNNEPELSFLSKTPIEVLRSGNFADIPYIAGYTQTEGTIRINQAMYNQWTTKMEKQFTDFIPMSLEFFCRESKKAIGNNIREQYFDTEQISMKNLDKYFDYHGDVLITIPLVRGAQERAATSKDNVRLFEFAYNGTRNSDWPYTLNSSLNGARHGALPKFLFDYDLVSNDVEARNSIIDLITGFAFTGKPFRSLHKSEAWLPIREETLNKLYISGGTDGNTTKYSEELVQENKTSILFWEIVLQRYYKAPEPPKTSAASYLVSSRIRSMSVYILVQIIIFSRRI